MQSTCTHELRCRADTIDHHGDPWIPAQQISTSLILTDGAAAQSMWGFSLLVIMPGAFCVQL
jgi:hypothetical protein